VLQAAAINRHDTAVAKPNRPVTEALPIPLSKRTIFHSPKNYETNLGEKTMTTLVLQADGIRSPKTK